MAANNRGEQMIDDTDQTQGAPEEGFLDIAANGLAVILFVTMLLLLAVSVTSAGRPIPQHDKQVTLPEPKLGALGPFRLYYLVSEKGISPLDLSPFHKGFFAGERRVTSDIGTASLSVDRQGLSTRDMNAYAMTMRFNPAGVANRSQPLQTEEDADRVLAGLAQQLEETQAGAVTFIIARGGASRFSQIFHRLDEFNISFRMAPLSPDWELTFQRKAVDFSSRVRAR